MGRRHLVDVLGGGNGAQAFPEGSGMYSKNTPISSSSPLMKNPLHQMHDLQGQTQQKSATISSQSLLPRMQFDMPGNNPQRVHATQILSDQMFNMGATNTGGIMPLQQQLQQQKQYSSQGAFGNMGQNSQNLQSNMVQL